MLQGIRVLKGIKHFWGFPLYHPLDGKKSLSNASTAAIENQKLSVQE